MKNNNLQKILSFLMITAFFVFAGCTTNDAVTDENTDNITDEVNADTEMLNLTIEDLKDYNGADGMPAYVAYDGVIYDVTDDPQWTSGSHGGNMAGTDITEKLNNAPHGTSKLNGLDAVGKLVE